MALPRPHSKRVGFLTAHAVVARSATDGGSEVPRDFTAWGGMTLREILRRQAANKGREPAGGKPVAQTVRPRGGHALRNARSRDDQATQWQRGILARRPMKAAVMAQAAKTARIVWAVLASGKDYAPRAAASEPRRFPLPLDRTGRRQAEQGAKDSDGKMVRTWVGTIRFVIAPHERAAMLGTRSAAPHRGPRSCTAPKGRIHDRSRPVAEAFKSPLRNGGRPYMTIAAFNGDSWERPKRAEPGRERLALPKER